MRDDSALAAFSFVHFSVDVDPTEGLTLFDAISVQEGAVGFHAPLLDFVVLDTKRSFKVALLVKKVFSIFKI